MTGKSEIDQTDHPLPIDGRAFDLLVDGELDSARQRELLSRLDATPDEWRRCALAFLEAQAWRGDLRTAVNVSAARTSNGEGRGSVRQSLIVKMRRWSLVALSVCLAFAAGWLTRPEDDRSHDAGQSAPLANVAKRKAISDENTNRTMPESDEAGPQLPSSMRMAGMLTLQVDDHGRKREVRVPVLDGSGIDVRSLLEQEPAARSPAIQALERRGHTVETHRQVLTVDLKDGRKLFLPVDQVDVRIANRVYQ